MSYKRKLDFDFRSYAIRKCIKQKKIAFDLIHAQFTWPSAYCAALLKEEYHVPYILTPHEDPGWLKEEIDLKDRRMERAWADADTIMYMNSFGVSQLKKFNPRTDLRSQHLRTRVPSAGHDDQPRCIKHP